jgi:carboxypeptidase C (cathepsin A)
LTGIAIGNGWVDPIIQYGAYADYLYGVGLLDDVSTTAYDDVQYPACEALIEVNPYAAFESCNLGLEAVLADAEAQNFRTINVYNVKERCEVEPLCYDFSAVTNFLNEPHVVKALGANPNSDWEDCNQLVHLAMIGDWIGNYAVDLPPVLALGIPVLVYSGTDDFICNYIGGMRWVSQMPWSGQNGFNKAAWSSWVGPTGNEAGQAKAFGGLTFLQVFDAGHMVPMDQPVNALAMFSTFLQGQPFGESPRNPLTN